MELRGGLDYVVGTKLRINQQHHVTPSTLDSMYFDCGGLSATPTPRCLRPFGWLGAGVYVCVGWGVVLRAGFSTCLPVCSSQTDSFHKSHLAGTHQQVRWVPVSSLLDDPFTIPSSREFLLRFSLFFDFLRDSKMHFHCQFSPTASHILSYVLLWPIKLLTAISPRTRSPRRYSFLSSIQSKFSFQARTGVVI